MSCSYGRVKTPVSLPIPGGSKPGKVIILRGQVTSHSGFEVNVLDEEDGDILFHFNPRIDEGEVVRNTCLANYWGEEQRDQPCFPFEKGNQFVLKIAVFTDEFRTYVNGKHFIDFAHRTNPENGMFLHLGSGAKYFEVIFKDSFVLPYNTEIPDGMQIGKTIRIRCTSQGGDGFTVDFACDSDNEVIPFQINVSPEEGAVSFNAYLDGSWGDNEDEYQGDYPFYADAYFDAHVICTENMFQVHVNDNYLASFNHRCELESITYLTIDGELDIADVQILAPIEEDYVKEIPDGLTDGDCLYLRGIASSNAEDFVINLHYGLDVESDIALHVRPNIAAGEIAFCSRYDEEWNEEETTELPQSIADGEPFEMEIIPKGNKMKVYIDGNKIKKYKLKGSSEGIEGVNVTGGVDMFLVELDRILEKPVFVETGVLQPGSWIIINGVVEKHADEFSIYLYCGSEDGSDIAFHFNPKFDEECTVRNSWQDGSWGEEERDQDSFPFQRKESFEIVIKVTEEKFMVYVDGNRYIDFYHRIPLDQIGYLQMLGAADFYEPEIL